MIALLQHVSSASIHIEGTLYSSIGEGLLVFIGIYANDTTQQAAQLAKKTAQVRIFEDPQPRIFLNAIDAKKEVLVVSQFTLCATTKKGNRPCFTAAARADVAEPLYRTFIATLQDAFVHTTVQEGVFGANMQVRSCNLGPYTLLLQK